MALLSFIQNLSLVPMFVVTLACAALIGMVVIICVRLVVHLLGIAPGTELPIRDALISSSSTIFALMVAFSAAGIWHDTNEADKAVQKEADCIGNVLALSSRLPDQMQADINEAMVRYAHLVVHDEWPAMARHAPLLNDPIYQQSDKLVVDLIDRIDRDFTAAAASVITQLTELRTARLQRAVISAGGVSAQQWLAIVMIATMAMTAIAVAHNNRIGLQLFAVSLYAIVATSAAFVILAHDLPFVGHISIKPGPIVEAIQRANFAQKSDETKTTPEKASRLPAVVATPAPETQAVTPVPAKPKSKTPRSSRPSGRAHIP